MTPDLERSLHELAERARAEHSARGALPLAPLTARTRRARRNVALTVSGTSVAACMVVAGAIVAGAGLLGPTPAPADTPTSSPTASRPSSAPTTAPATAQPVTSVVLPSGDPSLPFGVCGSLIDAAARYPVNPLGSVIDQLNVDADPIELAAGEPLPVSSMIELSISSGGHESAPTAVPEKGPTYAVAHAGVVVAVGDLYDGLLQTWDTTAYESAHEGQAGDVRLAVCDPSDGSPVTAGRALPAGDYTIHPWAEIIDFRDTPLPYLETYDRTMVAATLASAIETGGVYATVLGEVVPLRITGDAVDPQPVEAATAPGDWGLAAAPRCGAAAPATSNGAFRLTLDGPPTIRQMPDGTYPPRFDVTYAGAGRVRAGFTTGADLWVVQDGVVVGMSPGALDVDAPAGTVRLGPGTSYTAVGRASFLACTDDTLTEAPLGAGAYTAVAGTWMHDPDLWTPTGWVKSPTGTATGVVFGEPFELIIP